MKTRHRTLVLAAVVMVGCSGDSTAPPTPRATSIRLTPSAVSLTALGATDQLSATVLDQDGNAMAGASVTWSSANAAVAKVSATGLVTAEANGATAVSAASGSATGQATVTVQQVPATLEIEPSPLSLEAGGDTVRVTVTVKDANGNAVPDPAVTWSSRDPSVATVDGSGLVTSAGVGPPTLTAGVGSMTATVTVTVTNGPVIKTTSLPYARTGQDYQYKLEVSGDASAYTWSEESGVLTYSGLALGEDGTLYGTPTDFGTLRLTVRATNQVTGRSTTRELQLKIYLGLPYGIGAQYRTWFSGSYGHDGPGLALSTTSFQHMSSLANAGMAAASAIPRSAFSNDVTGAYYLNIEQAWTTSDRALSAVANGLEALTVPEIAAEVGTANVPEYRAFGFFVQGMSLATEAILFDKGFIDDADVAGPRQLVPYPQVMDKALQLFDQAAEIATQNSFTLPYDWIRATVASDDLVKIIHSMKARYRAAVARTPTERAAVDWNSVIADVDAGVTASFMQDMDPTSTWAQEVAQDANDPLWASGLPYWIYGMADQSGSVQRWLATPLADRVARSESDTILIRTLDTRFPTGETVAEQEAHPGRYFSILDNTSYAWMHPERGSWRWSYYGNTRYPEVNLGGSYTFAEINIAEMDLLKAEGLYRMGDKAGAASLVNKTRTANGLNATDAAGTNTSCVPKLPGGQCGDLWEMLKWEKRMEVNLQGLFGAPGFFDARGWGDLWRGTALEFPVPCRVLYQETGSTACYTFGGVGGIMSAPRSTYAWAGEG